MKKLGLQSPRMAPPVQRLLVEKLAAFVRIIPINRKIKGLFIILSLALSRYRFDFKFLCQRIGVRWSARGFPDLMTRHMLFEGMYQEDVLLTIRQYVKQGDVVYDVGGHHGLMAIIASFCVGSSGKVVTFEPNPCSRGFLLEHLELNKASNVIVENVALSDKKGESQFYAQVGSVSWNSTIIAEFADMRSSDSIVVPTVTLDEYVSRSGLIPRLIKIDTEGSECLILRGARQTLAEFRPVLIMEFNPTAARAAGLTLSELVSFLEEYSYNLVVLKKSFWGYYNFELQEPYEPVRHSEGDNLVNVICVPSGR